MKKHRGFSMLELMVVLAVVGLGSTVAVFAMSEQIGSARSRSDRIGIALKLKTERDRARERLTGVSISVDTVDAHTVRFHKPLFIVDQQGKPTGCGHGAVVGEARFARARINIAGRLPCLDENGRPVGGGFDVPIVGDDGETDVFSVNAGGGVGSPNGPVVTTINQDPPL